MSNPKLWKYRNLWKYPNIVASVGERLGWQECKTCEGTGELFDTQSYYSEDYTHPSDCHNCVDGWTPPTELVERVKKRLNVSPRWRKLTDDEARAVLLEQARWIGEQE